MKTFSAKATDVTQERFVIDAPDKFLGGAASEVALRSSGEHKAIYSPHVDLVITNVSVLKLTDKTYYRHLGYPGGITATNFRNMPAKHLGRALEKAVKGMLPKGLFALQTKKTTGKALENLEDAIQAIVANQIASKLAVIASVEAVEAPPPELELNPYPGYEAAVRAGVETRTRIFKGPDMLTSDQVAKQLGVSRETINQRRNEHSLLGLTNGTRNVRYPQWQLEPSVHVNLPAILSHLKGLDVWAVYLFFTQGNPLLDGRSPLESLRVSEAVRVIDAAESFAAEVA